ncbi:cytochrome c [Devosia sp. MC532]|uniref:cytochrome c n=1 Tax=Devosia sp. MC532 TaxID=2799788 RepID=UPI0018F73182|nr:cytochrome c [Devosia sp. MC532]MBJ7579334.1 cytochrome c [Devosia sp. MC532]
MMRSIILAIIASTSLASAAYAEDPARIISIRQGLMQQTAFLSALARSTADLDDESKITELYEMGMATAQSLEAFEVMFQENTNLLGGAAPIDGVTTTAAAAVWDDIEAFRALVQDSAQKARAAAVSSDVAAFSKAWESVEATCASCHEAFVFYDPFAAF